MSQCSKYAICYHVTQVPDGNAYCAGPGICFLNTCAFLYANYIQISKYGIFILLHTILLTVAAQIVKLKKILQCVSQGSDLSFNIASRGVNDSLTPIIKVFGNPESFLLM